MVSSAEDLAGRELDDQYEFGFTTGEEPNDGDEGEFPLLILLAVAMAIIVAVIIVYWLQAGRKKPKGSSPTSNGSLTDHKGQMFELQ